MEPFRISLDRARREAKVLLAAGRAGDPDALARFRSDRAPRLTDAQHAVAVGHGLPSWPELVRATEDAGAALRRAARRGDDELVYALLAAGAPPNSRHPRTGRTALHLAVAADQLDTVAALVGWVPVDLRAVDGRNRSVLDLARPGSPVAAVLASCGLGPARPPLADTHARLAWAAEVALADHLSRAPGVERATVGQGFWFRSGLADNTRNGVVCSGLPPGLSAVTVIDHLGGLPAIWFAGPEATAGLAAELTAAGAEAERASVHVAASLDHLHGALDPEVREVHRA